MTTTQESTVGNPDDPPPATGGQNKPLLIAEQRSDPATGGQLWIAAPAGGFGPEREIRIRIPSEIHDREHMRTALSGQSEKAKLYLVKCPNDPCYQVLHAEPALPDAQRVVHDENGPAYAWTRELDETVDELFQHAIQARIFALQEKLLDDDKPFTSIAAHARDIFASQMQSLGDARTTEELGGLFDHGMSPALEGARASYADAMMGPQLTEKGEVERVYYEVSVPLSQQIKVPEEPMLRTAAVANYAMQRAVYDYMCASIGQTVQGQDAASISFLESVEANLVRQRLLFGFHPTRTSTDYIRLMAGFSDRLVSATVQGVVCSMGGHAANEDYDWVSPGEGAFGRDEHNRPCTLQSHLYDQAYRVGHIIHYADHEKNHGKPDDYLKNLNAAYHDSANEHVAAKEAAVAGAMERAMASGRTRLSDPGEFIKNRLHDLALAKKAVLSIFDEVESTPPNIF